MGVDMVVDEIGWRDVGREEQIDVRDGLNKNRTSFLAQAVRFNGTKLSCKG